MSADIIEMKKTSAERVKSLLKVKVIKAAKPNERDASSAIPVDPFISLYDTKSIIQPPFDLLTLATMPENCSELRPSLDSMVVNIEKLGYRIKNRAGIVPENEKLPPNVSKEIDDILMFFDNCVLDDDVGSFEELRGRTRMDVESTGNGYMEVIPSSVDIKRPAGLEHLSSWTMRLRKQDDEYTSYEALRAVRHGDKWTIEAFPAKKRFRRFVQILEGQRKEVYFKEWNDPRPISRETGEVVSKGTSKDKLAHEVIHFKLYCPRSPYGLPRWIGHLFAIYGSRAAEEINYVTFDNNNIPALALLATNVAVTDGSLERMKEFIEERVQGNKNYATILMIEGEPIGEGMKEPGTMKMELKPLTEYQHTDALFSEYIKNNNDMIRRAFRLPPIFTGRADDFSRATAEASRKLAEEQIFAPERNAFDKKINNTIVMRLGLANVLFQSNTPNVTDNYELTQLLSVAERSGGLTPRISRAIIEDVTNADFSDVAEEINPDLPFTLTMARENALLNPSPSKPADQSSERAYTEKCLSIMRKLLRADSEESTFDDTLRFEMNRLVELLEGML